MAILEWVHGARSIIELVGDGQFYFEVHADSMGIVCGLNDNDLSTSPDEITHGFMVQRGQYCIMERGQQMTPWRSTPGPNLIAFYIARIGATVYYTVADTDVYPYDVVSVPGATLEGTLAHTSKRQSIGTVFLDSSFGTSWDRIVYAKLYELETADTNVGEVAAALPAWRAHAQDAATNLAYAPTPAWQAAASDLLPDRLRAQVPPWTARAGMTAFDVQFNEVAAVAPGWRTEAPELKSRPKRVPGWRVRAQGPNQTIAVAPALYARAGDALNAAYLVAPAWKSRSMAPAVHAGMAYGEVVLPSLGAMPTIPTQALEPFTLVLGGSILPRAMAALQASPMTVVFGGGIVAYAKASLDAATIYLDLGGSITTTAVATLPVVPFALVLGGQVGLLSGVGEVFAMNITAGPGGTTRYVGYGFNSFAKINGRYYGASENGLYLLEGDDDAGQPIAATFGLGQLDFGNPQIKTASYCYLGAAAGAMEINVQALFQGALVDYTYPSRGHGRTMREVRFDLGRGLRSAYLTPTFSNVDGDAFEVDSVRFLINESTRRI